MEATPSALRESAATRDDPLYEHSLKPMLMVDDQRRCVDANAAACLFLRLPVESVRKLTVDDLTTPALRPDLEAMWSELLHGKLIGRSLPWHLQMPDGASVAVDISGTPHVRPGRHLTIMLFPAERTLNERLEHGPPPADKMLTPREREVLTLVALGDTGLRIASRLFLSPATVQSHVVNALIKLGAKNRAHAVALALQSGELDLPAPDQMAVDAGARREAGKC